MMSPYSFVVRFNRRRKYTEYPNAPTPRTKQIVAVDPSIKTPRGPAENVANAGLTNTPKIPDANNNRPPNHCQIITICAISFPATDNL